MHSYWSGAKNNLLMAQERVNLLGCSEWTMVQLTRSVTWDGI